MLGHIYKHAEMHTLIDKLIKITTEPDIPALLSSQLHARMTSAVARQEMNYPGHWGQFAILEMRLLHKVPAQMIHIRHSLL